ncbi:MAG: FtsX-like permease family protein [Actinobacteria bacterium]|nr:FtsX-like permease family protein [Actinomycetota bacterium]
MNQLLATLRHRPAPLAGTFVALLLAAVLVTVMASLIVTGVTYEPPAQALAATAVDVTGAPTVAVTSGSGQNASTDVLPLSAYRRVPASLARRITAIPGVKAAVPDVSVPVAVMLPGGRVVTGSPAQPVTGHGWASAQLAPFTLWAGRAPAGSQQIVIGAGLAARTGLRAGDTIHLAGRDTRPFTVTGIAGTPPGNPAGNWTVFFSGSQASALYGHPGQAGLIGVIATPRTPPAVLAARIGTAIGRDHLRVLTGSRRGEAEDLTAVTDRGNLFQAGMGAGVDVVLVALLVVASTVALSVSERRHDYALLRAVGATPGQVRGQIMAELGVLGALAGLTGVLPGIGLAALAMRGLDAHQIMPPGAGAWTSGLLVIIAMGAGTIIAELAGLSAGSALRAGEGDRPPSLPGWRMARAGLTRIRRRFAAAPLIVKILLVSTLMFLSPFAVPAIVVAGGLIYAPIAVGAGYRFVVASWRARNPTGPLGEAHAERRLPHPARLFVGFVALTVGITLCVVMVTVSLSATEVLNLALSMCLLFLAAVGLLGPLLVAAAEMAIRPLVRACPGLAARLALAEMRARPRRMASAVVPVALAVAFTGAVYLIGATQTHAAVSQARQRLTAQAVISAPGPGLAPAALNAVRVVPGVAAAAGITPTTIFAPYPGSETTAAEAVTPGPLTRLLDLDVTAGSLRGFGPGDIALSRLVTGKGAVDARTGQTITTYLADGTPYRAKVTAIYARSLGFADALIPADAAGGGHLGTSGLGEILAAGAPGTTSSTLADHLRKLAASYRGLQAAPRSLANAHAELLTAQTSYANNLILGLIAALAAVALVNTLIMATLERRDALRLLQQVGTTGQQLIASAIWETLLLAGTGTLLGASAAAAAIVLAAHAITGSWQPYLTWPPAAVILGLVAILTGLATLTPTIKLISRHLQPAKQTG